MNRNRLWNIIGLISGIVLLIGIFYKIPILFDFCLGFGAGFIIIEALDNLFNFSRVNDMKVKKRSIK